MRHIPVCQFRCPNECHLFQSFPLLCPHRQPPCVWPFGGPPALDTIPGWLVSSFGMVWLFFWFFLPSFGEPSTVLTSACAFTRCSQRVWSNMRMHKARTKCRAEGGMSGAVKTTNKPCKKYVPGDSKRRSRRLPNRARDPSSRPDPRLGSRPTRLWVQLRGLRGRNKSLYAP